LRRGEFIIFLMINKPAKWPIAKKKTLTKYIPTTNSYDFARRYGN
jgi:hypothetical protein